MNTVILKEKLHQLTYAQHSFYNKLIELHLSGYKELFISQGLLAKMCGMTRRYCNKTLKLFIEMEILEKIYRHRRSCIYRLNTLIFTQDIRPMLSTFFKALVLAPIFLSISLLSSSLFTPINTTVLLGNKTVIKGGVKMEANPIPDYIRGIQSLKLARYGQIKLSGMPKEAVEYAEKCMQYSKNIKKPFEWFFKMCKDYCDREKLAINWYYVDALKAKYAINQNARLLLDDKIYRAKQYHPAPKKTVQIEKEPVPTAAEIQLKRDNNESHLKKFNHKMTQSYQFKLWRKQIESGYGDTHILKHLIMKLETIDPLKKEKYICSCKYYE